MTVSTLPLDLASDVVLRDGTTLRLRPITRSDAPLVLEFFTALSEQSLSHRFMSAVRFDMKRAQELVDVDYDTSFVIVAERGDVLAGVAGYYRDPAHPQRAEVAFAVADALQGRGLGTKLLERLAELARDRRIRAFDAYVLGDNRRMMDVFIQSGYAVTNDFEHGIYHVTLSLETTPEFAEAAAARSQVAATASLRPFFEPRTVAVIGANREPGRIGSEIFRNLRECGFTGQVIPVNPTCDRVMGQIAYPSVTAVPGDIDLAVVVVPAAHVLKVADECIEKKVRALLVISAGFGEVGAAGHELEATLVNKVRAAGIRLIGPNCMGVLNTDPEFRLNATFSPVYPPEGGLAFSTQSGALGLAILSYVKRLNLGISSFASIGNKADVSSNDLIQYWSEDAKTNVILLYLESFGNPRKFAEIARRVGRRKPIAAVKAGRSAAGARAASSHTGARATNDALVDALLRESGVVRTNTLEELFEVASVLATGRVPKGNRVAIVSNAGGPAIMTVDSCEANGLVVAPLSAETQAELRTFLPAEAAVTNPVDMIASAPPKHYERALQAVARDPSVDSIIAIFIPPLVTQPAEVADVIRHVAASTDKPVLASFMGAQGLPPLLAPVPSFSFPESAAVALARATRYGEWLRKPVSYAESLPEKAAETARQLVADALQRGGGWLAPADAAALLECAGVNTARGALVHNADEAAAVARSIGFPVALKAAGAAVVHKTEIGGVKLDLATEDAVRGAFDDLSRRLGASLEAALVQPMIKDAVEIVVGGVNDPAFGPVVMCGSGGVLVELIGDTAFALCPVSNEGAQDLIEQTKAVVRLRGFRGAPPSDQDALKEIIVRISQLLDACPEIHELDLNPVMVMPRGAVAVDARIRIGPKAPPAGGRRIRY
jgi:acetate---CoA ligase (ADP-forming)